MTARGKQKEYTEWMGQEEDEMMWSGFAVLLIVPAAFAMICIYVMLERSGILNFLRRFVDKTKQMFH